jgi:hypothetical protein
MIRVILLTLLFVLLALIPTKSSAQLVSVPIPGSGLYINVMANPQPLQYLNANPSATNVTMGDDSVVNVPLPFTFPFYGQNFTNSWMYSNGAVNFKSGSAPGGFCCSGQPLTTSLNSGYNYSILPLWTDLIAGSSDSSHYKLGTSDSMTYGWYNINQYGTNNKSSFEVKIDSTGAVDMRTSGMFVSTSAAVTIGTVGDASKGEFTQLYYGQGINIGATQAYGIFNIDSCSSNPLSSANCAGYAAAYLTQQCNITQLYSSSCPGYAAAYLTQQCSLNPLYNSGCSGYAAAYKTQRCDANPLYATDCSGYSVAYFTQQCNLNGLYDQRCPNYSTAYARSQVLTTTTTTTTSTTTASTTTPSISVSSSGTVSTTVPLVSDTNVNNVITSTTTSAAPSATAAVPLVSTTPQQGVQNASVQTSSQASAPAARQETASSGNSRTAEAKPEAKAETKSNSQQMKDNATAKAKEEMKKNQTATTLEAQIATQGAVVNLMSFVPGFDNYQTAKIVDINALRMQRIYGKDVVENRFVNRRLFGGSDRLHQEMIEQQYQLGN